MLNSCFALSGKNIMKSKADRAMLYRFGAFSHQLGR